MPKEKTWYALYVKSRNEKKVATELKGLNIDYYLPLEKKLKQWSDRKKWVEEPLFRSYIFVHIEQKEYYEVLRINGAVKYVSFEGKAVAVPPRQIDAIKIYLQQKDPETDMNPSDWQEGKEVEVMSGKLTGLRGKLVKVNGKNRVKVEIEVVGSAIILNISRKQLRIID
ncbi:UpxY family transcription antiterminator [Candidatus Sulfidibacterium hydrothermale]|uniref:UpxY family transcription antiterminator n=1 Tax=Candidatus Sulfidibacterium hydrothermale TaxID=2875962 RepID=UPI001F0AD385|nr:UpxY family transcription antiterminator [Candidatus Sulfidibacterium hydrothermale]UBM62726.1 UpxY family transcription antiterminator [Candidatus Sulfidibacterium hydrothermale]